jgi:hypothetical protein
MDIALTAQFYQNYFENGLNDDAATDVEGIRSLFGLATGALLAAGQSFKQMQEELGKEFAAWIYSNEFVTSDVNRLIKLFDYFGDNFDALTSAVSPLQLLRLLTPNQRPSRAALADFIDECNDEGTTASCADIDSIQRQYKIKSVPTIKSLTPQVTVVPNVQVEPTVDLRMVGNQQGGVGIFRLEVKDYQLANQLDTQWKESGFTANQWMRFMSTSARTVQEIAQVVLGRTIVDVSELEELMVAIKGNKLEVKSDLDLGSTLSLSEIDSALDGLPVAVSDCLKKINYLDCKIAFHSAPVGTDAMMRRMYREKRDLLIALLKTLAVDYELDVESLLLTASNSIEVRFVA